MHGEVLKMHEKSPNAELRAFSEIEDVHLAEKIKKEQDDAAYEESENRGQRAGRWMGHFCLRCKKRCCSVKNLKRRLPILTWLPKYSLGDFEGDIVAGITVALTVIPQGLALAGLASLPPQYGLYTAFMGCFMYVLFGSCKDLTIGPTAIMSLMTAEHVHKGGPVYAILLSFLCGVIQLAMGFLNLGFLVSFISGPVISGFTSAAAITIALTQLKGLFGLKFHSEGFFQFVYKFFTNLKHTNLYDMAMGLTCVFLLLFIRQFKDRKFPENSRVPASLRHGLEKIWFMFATGRNAILVLICAGIAAVLLQHDIAVLSLTKAVESGLPPFALPDFSYDAFDTVTNTTVHLDFVHMIEELGSGVIIIPLLSILEAIAIAKAFAKGKKLDATQEMIALGACNLMGSFVAAYPSTGSFSRTAINNNSGVRTPMSGIFTGAIVLLALSLLAPYFKYIPNASLSAIIFVAVIFMVHYQDVPLIWRTNKLDLLPLAATFIGSFVLGLEYGILLGVVISLTILLYQHARPNVVISNRKTSQEVAYLHVRPDRSVFFPSIEYVKEKINKALPDDNSHFTFVYDGTNITSADYTMALGIKNMIDSYQKEHITTVLINLKPGVLSAIEGTRPCVVHYCSSDEEMEAVIHANSRSPSSLSNSKLDLESKIDVDVVVIPTTISNSLNETPVIINNNNNNTELVHRPALNGGASATSVGANGAVSPLLNNLTDKNSSDSLSAHQTTVLENNQLNSTSNSNSNGSASAAQTQQMATESPKFSENKKDDGKPAEC